MTTADAAASASARNGSGRARTSLRSAALICGVADADGPATRNSVPRLGRGQPAQVRSRTAEQRPAPAASRLRVDGDPGHRERLEVPARRALGDLELVGELGRGDPPSGLKDQQDGDETVGSHGSRFSHKPATWWPRWWCTMAVTPMSVGSSSGRHRDPNEEGCDDHLSDRGRGPRQDVREGPCARRRRHGGPRGHGLRPARTRMAPARPPRSGSSPRSFGRTPAVPRSAASTWCGSRRRCGG